MKKLVLTAAVLCSSILSADGIGINLGPLNMGVGYDDGPSYGEGYDDQQASGYPSRGYQQTYTGGDAQYQNPQGMNNPGQLKNQLCQAIQNQNQIEIVVETREVVNAKEAKMVTKRVVIEPYGLAATKEGQPMIRGNVVSEKNIKEVTVKYEEDHFKTDQKNGGSPSSSWFSSSKVTNFDLSRVKSIQLVNNSHFDAPKDYAGFNDDSLFVICEIPVVKK